MASRLSLDFRPAQLFKTGVGKTGVEPPVSYIAEEGHLQEKKKKGILITFEKKSWNVKVSIKTTE